MRGRKKGGRASKSGGKSSNAHNPFTCLADDGDIVEKQEEQLPTFVGETERADPRGAAQPPRLKYAIAWLDLEMTGLDPSVDVILEAAVVVTDGALTTAVQGPSVVIHHDDVPSRP